MGPGAIQPEGAWWRPLPPRPLPIRLPERAPEPAPARSDTPLDPVFPPYWQYLERVNKRRPAEPVGEPERGRSATDRDTPKRVCPKACGEGTGLGMPGLGEIPEARKPEIQRKVEEVYRLPTRLPTSNVINLLA